MEPPSKFGRRRELLRCRHLSPNELIISHLMNIRANGVALVNPFVVRCVAQFAVNDPRRRRVRMRLRFLPVDDVRDFNAARFQEIRNQSAMTAPPNRFRAHERSWSNFVRKIDKAIDAFAKLFSLHVIGVTAECFVAPHGILRMRLRFPTAA